MKKQFSSVTRGSLYSAIASSIIYSIEDSVIHLEPERVYVNPPPWDAVLDYREVVFEVYGVAGLEGESISVDSVNLTVRLESRRDEPPPGSASLREVYETLPVYTMRADSSLLKSLSVETDASGVEYTLIYALDGRVYVLEGDRYSSPVFPVRVAGFAHTHPAPACGLSSRDVRIASRLLDSYSIYNAVISDSCVYYLVRVGLLSPGDYVTLLNYRGDLDRDINLESVVGRRVSI